MESWKTLATGAVVGAGLVTIFGLDALNKHDVSIRDLPYVSQWKEEVSRVYAERKKEECVDWRYSSHNKRDGNNLTIYYPNESWLMESDDINDLCTFMKDFPFQTHRYLLVGREDFAERRHSPTNWKMFVDGEYRHFMHYGDEKSDVCYDHSFNFEPQRVESSDYITPRLEGFETMMYMWCVPDEVTFAYYAKDNYDFIDISSEKLGPRGMGICDTTANANDRYVQITAIPKEKTVLQPEQ